MIFDATTKDRIGLSLPGIDAFLLVLRCVGSMSDPKL